MALGLEALGLLPRNLAGALGPKAQSASGGRYHWLVYEIENFPFRIEGCLSAARAYHIGLPVVWEFPFAGAFHAPDDYCAWGAVAGAGTKFRMGDLCYPLMSPER